MCLRRGRRCRSRRCREEKGSGTCRPSDLSETFGEVRGVRAVHNRTVHARFYAPDAHTPGDLVTLPEDEGEHLTRVLRLKPGDALRVFNGLGSEFDAVVDEAGKRGVRVR